MEWKILDETKWPDDQWCIGNGCTWARLPWAPIGGAEFPPDCARVVVDSCEGMHAVSTGRGMSGNYVSIAGIAMTIATRDGVTPHFVNLIFGSSDQARHFADELYKAAEDCDGQRRR